MTMAARSYHPHPCLAHSAHSVAERMRSSRWRDFRAERYNVRTGNGELENINYAVERTSKYTSTANKLRIISPLLAVGYSESSKKFENSDSSGRVH